jgi:hypothetical protein
MRRAWSSKDRVSSRMAVSSAAAIDEGSRIPEGGRGEVPRDSGVGVRLKGPVVDLVTREPIFRMAGSTKGRKRAHCASIKRLASWDTSEMASWLLGR